MKSLPVSQVDLPATGGSTVVVASYPFLEGVLADITIEGLIQLSSDPRASPINYSGPLDWAGVCIPNGSAHLDAKIQFSMGSPSIVGGGVSPRCNIPRTMANFSTRAVIAGTATAIRGPLPNTNYFCNAPCVYEARARN